MKFADANLPFMSDFNNCVTQPKIIMKFSIISINRYNKINLAAEKYCLMDVVFYVKL